MSGNSVSLHRVIKTNPEKLYRAFIEPNALAAWLPPYGFVAVVHQLEAKLGGNYKMSFINFSTGKGQSFGGKYLEMDAIKLFRKVFLQLYRLKCAI